ncbi:MAG: energy transducer TonB [Bacteroidales bacterium]|nr:energy transducer TonB [Bacteroidales bacterium]
MKKNILFFVTLILSTLLYGQTPVFNPNTPKNRIESQVQNAFADWAEKGEFEKTIVYNERIENNAIRVFDSLCEYYILSEIKEIYQPISYWSITYNADEEVFLIKYKPNFGISVSDEFYNLLIKLRIQFPIPIEEAPRFKQNHKGRIEAMPYGLWREKNGYLIPSQLVLFNNYTYDSITNVDMPLAETKDIVILSNILTRIPQTLKSHSYKFTHKIPANINNSTDNGLKLAIASNGTFRGRMNDNGSGQPGSSNGNWGTQGGAGCGIGVSYSMGGRRGTLPVPSYQYQKNGKVVVEISVDREGNVIEVMAPAKGSTLIDRTLIEASRQAAFKAHFNTDPDAPEIQKGTITYIFRTR